MDVMTKKQRSECMSKIKSKWTKPEIMIHNFLKGNKIKHKMHSAIYGHPDVELSEKRALIFINGCFWHKCKKCFKEPKSRTYYWVPKINKNVQRDKKNCIELKRRGYIIVTIWEHEIKKNNIKRVIAFIKKSAGLF
jgi:DNA mismatch endonuclease (patch repair protein)